MNPRTTATCSKCGVTHEFPSRSSLPESGGFLSVHEDRIVEFICGTCWAARPSTDWSCPGCSRANPDWMNWCLSCQTYRPDPRPYVPDWDLIARDERDRKREAESLAAEWDREYPGWRTVGMRRQERL